MPSGDRDSGVFGRPRHRIIKGVPTCTRPAARDRRSSPSASGMIRPAPFPPSCPRKPTRPAVLFLQALPPAARPRLHRRACQDRRPVLPHLPELCPSGSRSHPHRARHFPSPGQGRAFHADRPPGAGLCSGLPDIPGTPRPVAGLLDDPRRNGHRSHRSLKGEVSIRRPGLGGSNPAGPHNRLVRGEPETRQCQGSAGCNARSCPCNLHRRSAGVTRVFRTSVWSRTGSPSSGLALHRVTRCRPSNT